MITKLHLRNFQGHRKSVLNLCPGINAIVGSTDSGKSSVVRALRWLFFGKPAGDGIQSYWGGETLVGVDLTGIPNIQKITRHKPMKDAPYYRVFKGRPGDTEPRIEYLRGTSAEKRIRGISDNMVRLSEEMNFQQQHDAPYMLSSTGTNISKAINEIVDLSQMDKALSYARRKDEGAKTAIKLLTGECSKLGEVAQAARTRVTALESHHAAIEAWYAQIEPLLRRHEQLGALLDWIGSAEEQLRVSEKKLQAVASYKLLQKRAMELDERHRKAYGLYKTLRRVNRVRRRLKSYALAHEAARKVRTMGERARGLESLMEKAALLARSIDLVSATGRKLTKAKEERDTVRAELTKTMGKACPLCGRATEHSHA